ncbi:MAG: WecB/TagA/CpsF family glycosyltransferase [Patescibacteria group bacterium]
MHRQTLRLLDVTIDNVTRPEALARAAGWLHETRFHHIVTPGAEFLLEATAHAKFRDILNRADLSLPDGMSLHLGARLTGQKLRQRIPGADFVLDLMGLAAQRGSRVFMFGGKTGVAEQAGEKLLTMWPALNIVGVESGSRGHWSKLQDHRIIERIHLAKPDILLVALGAPKQELWIDRHRPALHHVKIAMGVGRTFDYLAGTIKRAPAVMRQTGFEWLHTYLTAAQYHQPQFRRQRVTNATYRFIIELIKHRRARRS